MSFKFLVLNFEWTAQLKTQNLELIRLPFLSNPVGWKDSVQSQGLLWPTSVAGLLRKSVEWALPSLSR